MAQRHSDDDLYKIHSHWLGPAGITLPIPIPLKGIPVGAAAALLALMALRELFGATEMQLRLAGLG